MVIIVVPDIELPHRSSLKAVVAAAGVVDLVGVVTPTRLDPGPAVQQRVLNQVA